MRERIDVSEIEAKTKIRAKYLRALENEEWGLLPGPTFVKSFLRTYAQALGLDGKALVEEYRLSHERPSEAMLEPIVSTPQSRRPRRGGTGDGASRGYMVAIGVIGAVIVVLIVLLIAGGGSSTNSGPSSGASARDGKGAGKAGSASAHRHASGGSGLVALSLHPTSVVYVCLIGDNGHKLISGVDLQAGEDTPTYHAKRFLVTLGNSSVTMVVDGTPRAVPASAEAIGYSVTKAHGRHRLTSAQLPSCT